MKCPDCVRGGQTSEVHSRGESRTLLGWMGPHWDERGKYHSHDPNTVTTHLRCTNGHEWIHTSHPPCPNDECMYGKRVPSCCGGGPQWGHAWGCRNCPD